MSVENVENDAYFLPKMHISHEIGGSRHSFIHILHIFNVENAPPKF